VGGRDDRGVLAFRFHKSSPVGVESMQRHATSDRVLTNQCIISLPQAPKRRDVISKKTNQKKENKKKELICPRLLAFLALSASRECDGVR
jgi:hypothetical protein